MGKYAISVVHATMIPVIWDEVLPIIMRVVEKAPDDIDPPTVLKELMANNQALMTISDGSTIVGAVTIVYRVLDSGVKTLYLPIVAGDDLDGWMDDGFNIIIAIAKNLGCTELRGLSARKGWMRKLQQYGWEECFTTVRCAINMEN